jgi:L-asparagine transporter-like permease
MMSGFLLAFICVKLEFTNLGYTGNLYDFHELSSYLLSWRFVLSFVLVAVVANMIKSYLIPKTELWLTKHMFAVGVIIFLLSRAIAFTIALYGSENAG